MTDRQEHEPVDYAAWEAAEPPTDFAERVVALARKEVATAASASPADAGQQRTRRRRFALIGGLGGLAAAVLALVFVYGSGTDHGMVTVSQRTEVGIGRRTRAVLEPGARLRWRGDQVVQDRGDVFYRVDKGRWPSQFRVHTPAGDVTVLGTCFRVIVIGEGSSEGIKEVEMNRKMMVAGATGAAVTALVFVGVYEGKVRLSQAAGRVDSSAGSAGVGDSRGVRKAGDRALAERAFGLAAAGNPSNGEDADGAPGRDLLREVRELNERLDQVKREKAALESQVAQAGAAGSQGAAPSGPSKGGAGGKSEFDLSPEDWAKLADEGTMKYRVPCSRPGGWRPSPETIQKLGLAPDDAATLQDAYKRSNDRMWATIRALCVQSIGSEALADKMGMQTCTQQILSGSASSTDGSRPGIKQVGEMRAGLRPMPSPDDSVAPDVQLFLALTGEQKSFEADLTEAFGPDEAHRLVYADDMCTSNNVYRTGKPQK